MGRIKQSLINEERDEEHYGDSERGNVERHRPAASARLEQRLIALEDTLQRTKERFPWAFRSDDEIF